MHKAAINLHFKAELWQIRAMKKIETKREQKTIGVNASKFELFVKDPKETADFYSILGFEIMHTKPDGYTTLENDLVVLALSPVLRWIPVHWLGFLRHPPIGTEIVFYVDNLESLRESFINSGCSPSKITLRPWGDRDFRVTDPNGYYIRLTEGVAVPRND